MYDNHGFHCCHPSMHDDLSLLYCLLRIRLKTSKSLWFDSNVQCTLSFLYFYVGNALLYAICQPSPDVCAQKSWNILYEIDCMEGSLLSVVLQCSSRRYGDTAVLEMLHLHMLSTLSLPLVTPCYLLHAIKHWLISTEAFKKPLSVFRKLMLNSLRRHYLWNLFFYILLQL